MNVWMYTVCLALAIPTSSAVAEEASASPRQELTILHTNDLHGHVYPWTGWEGDLEGKTLGGLDRLAGAVKQVRESVGGDRVLLLDAGDAIGDTRIATETKGQAIIEIMNTIGYDAMVIGNHELDFTQQTLKERIQQARFPILAANIVDGKSNTHFAKPFVVKTVNGIKIGILGLAYANTPLTTARKNIAGLKFEEPQAVAAKTISQLRAEGAQIIVVLSHGGLGADRDLAKAIPGIDVIVGGHSHNRMKEVLREGETLIVQAGAHGSDLGRLDLTIEKGRVTAHRRSLILLEEKTVPTDPAVAQLIGAKYGKRDQDPPLGEAIGPVVRAQTLAGQEPEKRDHQSPADSLFADILRVRTGADVAFLPGVGYGVAIVKATITEDQLANFIPHDSKTVTMTLTGAQLIETLEQAVENVYAQDAAKKVGGMIQVSGLLFRYDPQRPYGERVTELRVGEEHVDPKREYRVVTNSLLAEGGHNYKAFLLGKAKREGEPVYNVIKNAIVELKQVRAPQDSRIVNSSNIAQQVGSGVLRRLFGVTGEHCPQCGGQVKPVEAVSASEAINRLLTHWGLAALVPAPIAESTSTSEPEKGTP